MNSDMRSEYMAELAYELEREGYSKWQILLRLIPVWAMFVLAAWLAT